MTHIIHNIQKYYTLLFDIHLPLPNQHLFKDLFVSFLSSDNYMLIISKKKNYLIKMHLLEKCSLHQIEKISYCWINKIFKKNRKLQREWTKRFIKFLLRLFILGRFFELKTFKIFSIEFQVYVKDFESIFSLIISIVIKWKSKIC